MQRGEIPVGESFADDLSSAGAGGGTAFDAVEHAAGLEQQDHCRSQIAAAAPVVAGECSEDEQWFVVKAEFPMRIGRGRGELAGPWRGIGIVQFLEQIPAAADIPVVGLQSGFGLDEYGERVPFLWMQPGKLNQFLECVSGDSGIQVIYIRVAEGSFLFAGDGKVAWVVRIEDMSAEFGVDDGQPVGEFAGGIQHL